MRLGPMWGSQIDIPTSTVYDFAMSCLRFEALGIHASKGFGSVRLGFKSLGGSLDLPSRAHVSWVGATKPSRVRAV